MNASSPRPPNHQASIATVPVETISQPRRVVTSRIHWRNTFAAFRHRNYRLFYCGQFVSLIGTWMQSVAQGWLVYDLSKSAFLLGLVGFLGAIPVTALTLIAGAMADRKRKRLILIATQTVTMILALVLAALVYSGVVTVWHVGLIALLIGVANAFDIPTRQSFVVEMVGRDDLMNAIALNSSMFHAARVCGPAIAGVLIGIVGVAGCFFINGLSFLAIIFGYLAMRTPDRLRTGESQSIGRATLEAFAYVRGNPLVMAIVTVTAVFSLFGLPYAVLMPVFARDVLHAGASGLGYLMAANGIGSFLGAITLASVGDYPHKRRLFFGGLLGFCLMTIVFALSKVFWLSAAALVCSGFLMIIAFATANTSVQLRTPDELRGRVMGIYTLAFLGLMPFGSLLVGSVARATNAPFAVALCVSICAVATLVVMQLVPFHQNSADAQQKGKS